MSKHATLIGWPKYDPKRYRFAIPNAVWERKLKPVEFVIFSYFCYWHSRALVNTLTPEMVAEGIHLSVSTVKKYLSAMASKGLVTGKLNLAPRHVGSEKFFTLPNEVFLLKLPPTPFVVYAYLLLIENRRTRICHPSYNTIAAATGVAKNTALKSISVLEEMKLIAVEPSSYLDKRGMKRKGNNLYTILPVRVAVDKLNSRGLQKLYKDLMESGRVNTRSGKGNPGLSSTTVRSAHLALHCAFERAVKERLIPRNPTDDCIAPKVQKIEMKTLPPEHLKAYLDAANARDVLPMFYLELVSGLCKGELVALLWSDLNVQSRTISVSKQYVRNPSGGLTLSRPKTETSVRQVSIPQDAVELLIQEHEKHPDNPYMFPSPVTGEMYHPDSVVKLHEKILKDAKIEHIRFHDLRHTFATLALQNGVDIKTVSSMLGHYDAGFTLRTYTHAARQAQDDAAEKVGSFMAQMT